MMHLLTLLLLALQLAAPAAPPPTLNVTLAEDGSATVAWDGPGDLYAGATRLGETSPVVLTRDQALRLRWVQLIDGEVTYDTHYFGWVFLPSVERLGGPVAPPDSGGGGDDVGGSLCGVTYWCEQAGGTNAPVGCTARGCP